MSDGPLKSRGPTSATTAEPAKVGEELEYSMVREHGLAHGYNLFASPPPPEPLDDARDDAAWYVHVKSQQAEVRAAHMRGCLRLAGHAHLRG